LFARHYRVLYVAQTGRFNMADQDNEMPAGATLTPAAQRALKEAEIRRQTAVETHATKEVGGPRGAEPTRFGDWERGGRAVDF
jgi:hypothetical protein